MSRLYMKDIIAIIPARSGSKGIKDKNISDIYGFPMLAYSIYAAKMCNKINRVIVSTDSDKYAKIAKFYGADVPFLRPKEISGSNSLDIEYLEYTLKELLHREGKLPDYIVLLRPTTPLRDVSLLSDAIEKMLLESKASSLVSVSEARECAYKWAIVSESGYLKSPFTELSFDDVNLPRQSFPKMFIPDGYVDVLRSDEILNNHNVYGNKAMPYFIKNKSIDVDNVEDLEELRRLAVVQNNSIYKKLMEDRKVQNA